MGSRAVRVGFLAGRGVDQRTIAEKLGVAPETVFALLRNAGVSYAPERGLCANLRVNIEAYVLDLDAVGRKRKMSRDEICADLLRILLAGGERAIEEVLDRDGGHAERR